MQEHETQRPGVREAEQNEAMPEEMTEEMIEQIMDEIIGENIDAFLELAK